MRALFFLLVLSCGEAEIIAPSPLFVVDTHPGNGSVIPPGETPIAVLFSENVVSDPLRDAVTLEETTEGASTIRELPVDLVSYDVESFTAVLRTEELSPGTFYALTISSKELRAVSGARMLADFVRRFRTTE